jgi:hypothetical protein
MLADQRARKREDLLVATEKKLAAIAARVHRAKKPLRGKDKIALAIGRVIDIHLLLPRGSSELAQSSPPRRPFLS